jgi:hypothetical protein
MRLKEFLPESGTVAGGIAPVAMPMGTVSRSGGSLLTGKYITGSNATPNTPKEFKRYKHARGRFKNSPGN